MEKSTQKTVDDDVTLSFDPFDPKHYAAAEMIHGEVGVEKLDTFMSSASAVVF